jgi:exodeoxyribonuclease-3
VKLISWNVNSLRARLPRVLELLLRHRPEVVCLQETKCTPDAFPEAELAAAGYRAVHHSGGRWAGVALLALAGLPVEGARLGLPGEPAPEEARWVEARVAGVTCASVYVPNGRALDSPEFPRKLDFLEAMAQRVAALGKGALVVAGDLNIAPADLDVYDPQAFAGSTHVSAQERAGLREILRAGALKDAYRVLHPEEVGYTWWDYRQGHFHRGLGLRIDLALVSQALAGRLQGCGIDRDFRKGSKPSDHAPLVVSWAETLP